MNEILFDRGTKRTCQSCEARFYDLARTPVICPKCGANYVEIVRPTTPPYQRRGRGAFAKSEPIPVEENEVPEPAEDEASGFDDDAEPEAEDAAAEE